MNILCFGEPLVRFATNAHERLQDAHSMDVAYVGAETVVAVSLAQQGESVAFATKLSDNQLGSNAIMTLARYGIDTSRIMQSPERMGIFYVERGKSIRPSIVTYDRSGTAMACATHDQFDWDRLLNGIEVFFFSGVVPAISPEMALACKEGLLACKGRGIRTITDLNYRKSMWSRTEALSTWKELLPMVDVLTASEDDIIVINDADIYKADVFKYCNTWAQEIRELYEIDTVGIVTRLIDRYDVATFRGMLFEDDKSYISREQRVAISDLSSCGSIFAAAVAHGTLSKWDPQFIADYATMASAFKATVRGDYSYAGETEIAALLADTVTPSIVQ